MKGSLVQNVITVVIACPLATLITSRNIITAVTACVCVCIYIYNWLFTVIVMCLSML